LRQRIKHMEERKKMSNNKAVQDKNIENRARFDIIRYASCWEDADVLIRALNVKEGGAYLSIASAGDNSLSLLSKKPSLVLAIDINPVQLACVEIRKLAFQKLSYEELLVFLGVNEGEPRSGFYKRLTDDLSPDAKSFWDHHPDLINKGIIHVGKFENYFALFRNCILPLIHSWKEVDRLLSIHDIAERTAFYNNKWNTFRWKMLFKVFFSRALMGKLGRDPEFFKYVETDVASRIFKRTEYALTVLPTDANPYLEYILTGNFKNALPFYLRRENFDVIRNNIDKLIIFKGNLREAFQIKKTTRFDGFNLSDIFEYMSYNQYGEEVRDVLDHVNSGGRLVYWNMLADRKHIDGLETKMRFLDQEASELFKQDKAFFYKSLIVGEAI
jgi:S-adenosylmethionine-diacylglycerol 3-amino-3-carboxypropyl transferase